MIELLVVIAIIGILSAVVLTSLNSSRQKARDSQRVSDIKQIALAMELERDGTTGNYSIATATMPTAIGTSLASVPANEPTNTGGAYRWNDNSANAAAFCVWTTLEADTDNYAASQNGSGYTAATPSLATCF